MDKKEIVTKLRDILIQLLDIRDNLEEVQEKDLTMDAFNSLNSLIVKLNKQP
ncbi:hypothetical protein [Clostridium sp. UBA5988]|uniref:hypothetical protein n=1 Tax=Clostridium sp. UBA5988 TaxID=1946369 RepID=UPI003217CD02